MSEPSTAADEAERQAADATYPARMEYRMFGDSDGTVDGEVWMVVQAWYWPGESLPREIDECPAIGNSPDELRRDLRAMLAATEKPSLTRDHAGKIAAGGE